MNERLASAGINIDAQFLRVRDELGYTVTDVDREISLLALRELDPMPGAIRSRVLC